MEPIKETPFNDNTVKLSDEFTDDVKEYFQSIGDVAKPKTETMDIFKNSIGGYINDIVEIKEDATRDDLMAIAQNPNASEETLNNVLAHENSDMHVSKAVAAHENFVEITSEDALESANQAESAKGSDKVEISEKEADKAVSQHKDEVEPEPEPEKEAPKEVDNGR